MEKFRKEQFDEVHENLLKNAEKMKKTYAKQMKAKPSNIKVGDKVKYRNLVDLKNPIGKKKAARTLFPKKGFLVVKEIHESGNYQLRKPNGKKIIKSIPSSALVLYTGPTKKVKKKSKLASTMLQKPKKIEAKQSSILPKRPRTRFARKEDEQVMWMAQTLLDLEKEHEDDSDFNPDVIDE